MTIEDKTGPSLVLLYMGSTSFNDSNKVRMKYQLFVIIIRSSTVDKVAAVVNAAERNINCHITEINGQHLNYEIMNALESPALCV